MMAWCAHYALNHWNHAGALEQVHLPRIFLKHLCECKPLYSALAVVVCRWFDRDMCRMAFAFFDAEEARIPGVRRAQAQEDVEERTRGSQGRLHVDVVFVLVENAGKVSVGVGEQKCGEKHVLARGHQQTPVPLPEATDATSETRPDVHASSSTVGP
jgi:hypothetical protein